MDTYLFIILDLYIFFLTKVLSNKVFFGRDMLNKYIVFQTQK